jgi:hypothetical protein
VAESASMTGRRLNARNIVDVFRGATGMAGAPKSGSSPWWRSPPRPLEIRGSAYRSGTARHRGGDAVIQLGAAPQRARGAGQTPHLGHCRRWPPRVATTAVVCPAVAGILGLGKGDRHSRSAEICVKSSDPDSQAPQVGAGRQVAHRLIGTKRSIRSSSR